MKIIIRTTLHAPVFNSKRYLYILFLYLFNLLADDEYKIESENNIKNIIPEIFRFLSHFSSVTLCV